MRKKLWMLLFAAVLGALAILTTPAEVHASVACDQCYLTGDCFACCRCAGLTPLYCYNHCP
jgi:hypothetical protein